MADCPTPYKRIYDRFSAFVALSNAGRRPDNTGKVPVRSYRCRCGHYHLSSKGGSR